MLSAQCYPEKIILGEIDGKSHLHGILHLWTSWWQATQIVCDGLFVAERTSIPRWLLTLSSLDIGVSGRKSLDGEDRNLPPVFWGIGDDGLSWFPWEDGKRGGQGSLGNELQKAVHGNAVWMFKVETAFYLARSC